MLQTKVKVERAESPELCCHPSPGEWANTKDDPIIYRYHLPRLALAFKPATQVGCMSLYPFGCIVCYRQGGWCPITSLPSAYFADLLNALTKREGRPLTFGDMTRIIEASATVLCTISEHLIANHPEHFPAWWTHKPAKRRKGSK